MAMSLPMLMYAHTFKKKKGLYVTQLNHVFSTHHSTTHKHNGNSLPLLCVLKSKVNAAPKE